MNDKQIFEMIDTMDPALLSQLFCEALDESGIEYQIGETNIVFPNLMPVQKFSLYTMSFADNANPEYCYENHTTPETMRTWQYLIGNFGGIKNLSAA